MPSALKERREAALTGAEETCPRCGAPRERGQEYCLECGFRLPNLEGRLPGWRRRWVRRFGWYPGDWIWVSLLTFLVAAAGTAIAIHATRHKTPGATTVVAPTPLPATTKRTTVPTSAPTTTAARTKPRTTHAATTTHRATTTHAATTHPAAPTTTTHAPAPPPNGQTLWPARQNGWTLVLISYPSSGGRAVPDAAAGRAAHGGLPQVGVLDSSDYASLHPGYYVVFSGIYGSQAEAEAALPSARAAGFGGAYTRQISR